MCWAGIGPILVGLGLALGCWHWARAGLGPTVLWLGLGLGHERAFWAGLGPWKKPMPISGAWQPAMRHSAAQFRSILWSCVPIFEQIEKWACQKNHEFFDPSRKTVSNNSPNYNLYLKSRTKYKSFLSLYERIKLV
jgi:hypothetical protein